MLVVTHEVELAVLVGIFTPDIDLSNPSSLHHYMISPRVWRGAHLGIMLSELTVTIALAK